MDVGEELGVQPPVVGQFGVEGCRDGRPLANQNGVAGVLGEPPFHAVFIRAPGVERVGPDVEVLAERDGRVVLARQGLITVAAFHPELSGDPRIHARFLQEVS